MTDVNINLLMNIRDLVCEYDTRFRETMQRQNSHMIDVLMDEIYGVFSIVGGERVGPVVAHLDPIDPRYVVAMAVQNRIWSWYNIPPHSLMVSLSPSNEDTIRDTVHAGPVREPIPVPPALIIDGDNEEDDDDDAIEHFIQFVRHNTGLLRDHGEIDHAMLINLARVFYMTHAPIDLQYGRYIIGPLSQFEQEAADPQFNSEMVRSESEVNLPGDDVESVDTDICAICKDPPTGKVRATVCGHRFCSDCISEWARYKTTCPVCRQSIIL